MYVLFRFIAIIIGYIFGIIQSGYFIGKIQNKDIRKYGSGNTGATNTTRVLGIASGVIAFIIDVAKPVFAYMLTFAIFFKISDPNALKIVCLYAASGSIIGHIYPFYLNFKGGKGVSSILGLTTIMIFGYPQCLQAWPALLIPLIIFILFVGVTGYVSLGSITGVIVLLFMNLISGENGNLFFKAGSSYIKEWYIMLAVLVTLVIFKHYANIKRLISGNENKFVIKKKTNQGGSK